MIIHYYGHSCFKINTKPAGRGQEEISIFLDPFDKKIGLRPPQGQANIVLVSHDHFDHNNVTALKGEPAIINIPGEYSVRGVSVVGIPSLHKEPEAGEEKIINTIFVLESEDLRVCHLGDLGTDLSEKQLEEINGVDILMIPIGGNYTIGHKRALELIKKIEPAMVIPMHYKMNGSIVDIADEKKFCNEIGNCSKERPSKLNIKKKDLEEKRVAVVLMGIE